MKTTAGRCARLVVLGHCLILATQLHAKPLKVFILAGQSNMQGHASVTTFNSMADDPKTAPLLKEMRDKDGKPVASEDSASAPETGGAARVWPATGEARPAAG